MRYLSLVVVAVMIAVFSPSASEAKPNVIVILCDDVGYGEFGFQGNSEIPTPQIDSIANSGVRFTNGYVSGPYCSPTRAGLLTGRYQTRYGHEFNPGAPDAGLPLTETTIAQRMKSLGYATAAVGKWHLGRPPEMLPMRRGFDEFYGTVANTPFFNPPQFIDSRESNEIRAVKDDTFYATDAWGERAVDFIKRSRAAKTPYFLYLPFNAQHAPLQATKKYADRVSNIADEKRRVFAAMMVAMDDAVGRVLASVREAGEEENTIVFFLSDNGGPTSSTTSKNGPLRGFKSTTSEGGVRVPFCVQWKGKLPAGKVYEHPVIQLDILPTVITAAGGKVEADWKLDGVDLMPYLMGEKTNKPHETLYWRFGKQHAIRKGDWKLVASRVDENKRRLINLASDIGEANDLSAQEPEKVKELAGEYEKWNAEQMEPLWKESPPRTRAQPTPEVR